MICPHCHHTFDPDPKALATELGRLGGKAGKGKRSPSSRANLEKAWAARKAKLGKAKGKYVMGCDPAIPGKDMSARVVMRRNPDGTMTIVDVQHNEPETD